VAAGLSDFFGIDVTLIRVLFVLSAFFTGGAGPLIYLVLWVTLPAVTPTSPSAPPSATRRGLGWLLVIVALIAGIAIAASDHRTFVITAVVLGTALLLWRRSRGRQSWKTRKEFDKARLAWQRRLDEHASQAARPTYLGGNPVQIDSFYPQSPPNDDDTPTNSGFQIQ